MSEWISVKDRLPNIGEHCLWFDGNATMSDYLRIHIDFTCKAGGNKVDCAVNYLHNYTHWMPLPQPPETDK
jgi:hypothetical protein